jgi:ubiquinone/menaquinone biosynthesis C-methylase UbiE
MSNPFGTDDMAAGYATSRPPVHPRVIEQAYRQLGRSQPFERALDVGCGAGVSTRALGGFAKSCIGLEPAEAMLKWVATIAPSADFVVGAAEAIPLYDRSVDLITAAGSLNYANLDLFFPEAARVLAPHGVLLVYDFSPGRSLRTSTKLDEWFSSFHGRYPPPANEARELSPEILSGMNSGFRLHQQQQFEIGVTLTPAFYLNYVMTETNVASAVRRGVPHAEIKSWCAETLAPVWMGSEREVLFRGYFVCMGLTAPDRAR